MVTMMTSENHGRRRQRPVKPLDSARLEELALGYVARFATSRARLEAYLRRKLRERGWAGDGEPPVEALALRFVAMGYIDDEAYARSRGGGLLRRGYGVRRVGQALAAAGIDQDMRQRITASEGEQRRAALTMARKRGFGPFAAAPADPARREKQLAAMLRAGHPLDHARRMIDAASTEEAERWVAEADT